MSKYPEIIYGKDSTEGIVGVGAKFGTLTKYFLDGRITKEPYDRFLITNQPIDDQCKKLEGDLGYNYIRYASSIGSEYFDIYRTLRDGPGDVKYWTCFDDIESTMLTKGFTLFKGVTLEQTSVLSFDIETTGLNRFANDAQVLLISNTYRSRTGSRQRRLFSVENYKNDTEMLQDWAAWVRQINPDFMVGHNIFGYDLPYMFARAGGTLRLGRDGSEMFIDNYPRKYRKDATQFYSYNNIKIFGRNVIDTMFLAMTFDVGRKYVSYALKSIIAQEGLERTDRQHYDAGQIGKNWHIPEEREKIKAYAEHDGDDSLALFELMIPSYFYYSQAIPKTLQEIILTATGSQINALLVRSYLQNEHSIPFESPKEKYEGAISIGYPGIYRDVAKFDVASLYPSIMLTYEIHDPSKDPLKHFLFMVDYFTKERLKNKRLAKETGERYYNDLQGAQKIVINSAYGMLGANNKHFNYPAGAAEVTRKGREILETGMKWVESNGYQLVNVDTDSFAYTRNKPMTDVEYNEDLATVNSLYPDGIKWEEDGYYHTAIIFKAKNYVLYDANAPEGKQIKIKGSALKDQKKEQALVELSNEIIQAILDKKTQEEIKTIYHKFVVEACNPKDIQRWASKKTITKAVLRSDRTNEEKVRDAIEGEPIQEGDKVWLYSAINGMVQEIRSGQPVFYKKTGEPKMIPNRVLKLVKNFQEDADSDHLISRVYDSVQIFDAVLPIELFKNYSLKCNQSALATILHRYGKS